MADNAELIASLREAIATGSRRIVFHSGGTRREVEYHSLKEMREALEWLENKAVDGQPKPAVSYVGFRMPRWCR